MTLSPEDLQALGVDQFDPYAVSGLPQQSLDAMTRIELPQAPAAPVAAPAPDKLRDPTVMDHLRQVMQHAVQSGPEAPKGLVKAGETVRVQDDGLTPEERAAGTAVRGQAAIDTMGVDRDRLAATADAYEQQAAKSRAEADVEDERRKQEEMHTEARMQRIREDQDFLAEQKDEPIDPQRYFKNMSLFGKAMALISAAAYGYVNSRNGEQGQAPIIGVLQQMASEDTRAQMTDVQNGRAKRSDQMALYERKYGDQSLIAKKLEADKLQTLGKRAMADAKQAKSAEAKASMEDMGKKMLINADVLNQTVSEAHSAQPMERTTTYSQAKGKGDPQANDIKRQKEMGELDLLWEKQGYSKEERARRMSAIGYQPPSGTAKTAAEQDQANLDAKAKELTPAEKTDLREKTDALASAMQGFDELDKQLGIVRRPGDGEVLHSRVDTSEVLSPSDVSGGLASGLAGVAEMAPWKAGEGTAAALRRTLPDDHKAVRRAAEKITDGIMRAASGAGTNVAEMEQYRNRLPVNAGTETFMRASREMLSEARQKYKNLVGQFGKKAVDEMLHGKDLDVKRKFGDYAP